MNINFWDQCAPEPFLPFNKWLTIWILVTGRHNILKLEYVFGFIIYLFLKVSKEFIKDVEIFYSGPVNTKCRYYKSFPERLH